MSRRFAIVGNCQITGLAQCLRLRLPDAQVETLSLKSRMTEAEVRQGKEMLADCEHVVAQAKVMRNFPHITAGLNRPLTLIPSVIFTAFHPDVVWPASVKGKIRSPMGAMNSRIVMAAFLLGLNETRAAKLFNAFVYRRLGYFEEFARAVAHQESLHAEAGWEFGDTMERWGRRGVMFMHQPLHPKIAVLDDIVVTLLGKLGEPVGNMAALPTDSLSAEAVWPVYPELARMLGVEGSMRFLPAKEPALDMDAFIAGSFAFYRRRPPDALVNENVLADYRTLRPLVA